MPITELPCLVPRSASIPCCAYISSCQFMWCSFINFTIVYISALLIIFQQLYCELLNHSSVIILAIPPWVTVWRHFMLSVAVKLYAIYVVVLVFILTLCLLLLKIYATLYKMILIFRYFSYGPMIKMSREIVLKECLPSFFLLWHNLLYHFVIYCLCLYICGL